MVVKDPEFTLIRMVAALLVGVAVAVTDELRNGTVVS